MVVPVGFFQAPGGYYLKEDRSGPYILDDLGNMVQAFPKRLFTDGYGDNTRLRVDVAQTGFFAGREFRTFLRLNIANGATQVIKAVVPLNIILFELKTVINSGDLDISTRVGGTEGGSFSTTLPNFRTNNMSSIPQPPYASQVVVTTGGTHTGGTEISVLLVKANDITNQANTIGGESLERGIATGTYYFLCTNLGTDPVVGLFEARWEERP